MKERFQTAAFRPASLALIEHANTIIAEYQAQGLVLTLRQLYYQFVSRDLVKNTQKSYDNLGALISSARLAGLVDWEAIEDRTRNLKKNSHWDSPADIVRSVAHSFMFDRWQDQPERPEVWIEKEALAGVLEEACSELDVAFFACRGYTSQSEMWRAGKRLAEYARYGQTPVIIHLGDHDPSGLDMSRDVEDRLRMFMGSLGSRLVVERIALNMDQVEEHQPPPNPAKVTDSRFTEYQAQYGDESWELDALDPATLVGLVREAVAQHTHGGKMKKRKAAEEKEREVLTAASQNWPAVKSFLKSM